MVPCSVRGCRKQASLSRSVCYGACKYYKKCLTTGCVRQASAGSSYCKTRYCKNCNGDAIPAPEDAYPMGQSPQAKERQRRAEYSALDIDWVTNDCFCKDID